MKTKRRDDSLENSFPSLEHYMKPILKILQYSQIVRNNNESFKLRDNIAAAGTLFFLTANILLIPSEIIIMMFSTNLQEIANVISSLGLHVTGFAKWVYLLKKNEEVGILFDELKKCHLLCLKMSDEEEDYDLYEKKMEKARRNSNLFIDTWIFCCVYGVTHWCINPMIYKFYVNKNANENSSDYYTLPYIAWYPWKVNNFRGYLYAYFIQCSGGMSSAFGLICYDAFYVSVLMIVCAQLQYLNVSIAAEKTENSRLKSSCYVEGKLKSCVEYHSRIADLLKVHEVLMSPTMFVQCIQTMVVLCLLSFEASTIRITFDIRCTMKLWSMLEYFSVVAVQLYIFCYYSTQIKHLCLQISDTVYCCGWESCVEPQANVKYLLQMIMVRSQKPILLTGGPFYVLSLETFKTIIGVAMSNAVILRQVSIAN